MNNDFMEYMSGFFDAEGSITTGICEEKARNTGYKMSPKIEISHAQVAGFFDGEGIVNFHIKEASDTNIGYHTGTRVQMKQGEDDPVGVLDYIQDYISDIGINSTMQDYEDHRKLAIHSLDGVEKFLTNIREYCLVKRPQIEIMLDEIIPMMRKGEHKNRRGFLRIMSSVDRMNSMKGGNRGKYNLEYFEEEWGMKIDKGRTKMDRQTEQSEKIGDDTIQQSGLGDW